MKRALLFLVVFISLATSFFPENFYEPILGEYSISHFFMGFFLLLFFNFNRKNFALNDLRLIRPFTFLFIWGIFSALWSPFPSVAAIFGIKLFFITNIFITTVTLLKKHKLDLRDLIKVAQIIVIVTIIGQIIGLYLGVNAYGVENTSAGLSDNVSAIAGQLLFTTPLILLSKNNLIQKVFLLLIFISILLTLRRSSAISFFLIFIFIFMYKFFSQKTSIKGKFVGLISILFFALTIGLVLTTTNLGNTFLNRVSELDPSQGGTASGRYDFQSAGLEYILNRDIIPSLFGEGFGYSVIVNIKNGFIPIGMHSDFLDIIIGLGIFGLIAFLMFYYRVYGLVRKSLAGTPNFNSGIAFLVALGSISLFTGGFFNINTIPGYIALAYIFADGKYVLKNSNLISSHVKK